MDAKYLIKELGLEPHPEGGYYKETYRAEEGIPTDALPGRYDGARVHSTCIYFLITQDSFSGLHRIASDEIFHFYAGDPVAILLIPDDGTSREVVLGNRVDLGHSPQVVVEKGSWQGARVKKGGQWALLGCTVAPGFEFSDFEMANRESICAQFPDLESKIREYFKSE